LTTFIDHRRMELCIPGTVIPGLHFFHRRPNLHKFGVTAGGCTVVAQDQIPSEWVSSWIRNKLDPLKQRDQ
jgi:hypothetical protein